MAQAIPDGYHSITPAFTFKDSEKAIQFYTKALGAEIIDFLPNPNGSGTMHATLQIGDSIIMMSDEAPCQETCSKSAESLGYSPVNMYLYVGDVDMAFKRAVSVGAEVIIPVQDMFWGDRVGQIKDPFGYFWMIATHKKDLSKDQIASEAQSFFEKMSKK